MREPGGWGTRLGSVRIRMTVAAVAVVAVGLAGAGIGLVRTVENSLVSRLRSADRAAVREISELIQRGEVNRQLVLVGPTLQFVQVITPDGDVLAASPSLEGFGPVLVGGHFVEPRLAVAGSRVRVYADPSDVSWEVTSVRVPSPQGPLTVVAASPLLQVERSVDTLVDALWIAVPLLIVLVGLLAWTLIGRALRPIDAIRAQVEEISSTTMDRRVPEPGTGDEVDRLAQTMNLMLDRLEAASDRQRRFVSDASHELRSPVAAIRTELEVALANPVEADWPAVATGVLDEDRRLEQLVSDLLELARLDEAGPGAAEEVDLDDVAIDRVAALQRRGVEVATTEIGAARVTGSRRQLDRLIRNLLDNAARHARARVRVAVRAEDGSAVLEVEDDGSGIAPEDRERVFARFTRLDEGRQRDRGGAGLGLALVREIAERHRGEARIVDGALGGARVVVRLPLAEG